MRALVIVLGDQLDLASSAFDGFDPAQDAVWMAEVAEESTHIWSSQQRIAIFLATMRHFAEAIRARGWPLHYTQLDDEGNRGNLAAELRRAIDQHAPRRLVVCAPGDHRVWTVLKAVAAAAGLPLDARDDRHFYATVRDFAAYARQHDPVRLETFYRAMRRRHGVLMDGDQPEGGAWNFDADNRKAFGRSGPGLVPERARFAPDAMTQEVITLVRRRFGDHPGRLDSFAWPVTRAQALQSLASFIAERLPLFGRYQDAMWPGEPWLYHAQLSAALNLKLLNPREVVDAALAAYRQGTVPLASAEGFVRQILGWREYVRGIYWTRMPAYADLNGLDARQDLPAWYWTGDTDMACLRDAITQTLDHGYAHHIQRLMVTGLYALLLGVVPQQVHAWYLSVYVDAVEWVELPNTLGMSQFADGGSGGAGGSGDPGGSQSPMGSKPYIATGRYIQRMGSGRFCAGCRFDPAQRVGPDACPFTTLYWDFLARHGHWLAQNTRMQPQVQNRQRLSAEEQAAIALRAAAIRAGGGQPPH